MSNKDYLDALAKSGNGAQAAWAKAQMGKVPTPPTQNMAAAPTASFTAAPAVPKANVPTPPQYTQDQLSHQSWINNSASGQGGMDAYTAKQNQRWAEANEKGDNDLISRLQADSQRVGYALSPIQSKVPAPVPAPPTTATPSTPNMAYNVGTNADREAEAKRRMELALSEKRRISEQQKKGLMDSYGKLRTNINEDRSLENTQLQRRLNPFSGRSDYANAMVERERGRTDREMGQDLSTRLANVDELLANYENASETERQRIVDELTRQDRDFGLQQGQLTGNYNGGRTLAGSQFEWSKEMDVADRTGYMGGQMGSQGMGGGQGIMAGEWVGNKSGAPFIPGMRTLQGQQFDRNILESDRNYNYQVGRDQVGDQRYDQEWQYKQTRDRIGDERYKLEFDQNAKQFGMQYALQKGAQDGQLSNQAADNALQRQNLELQKQKFEFDRGQTGASKPADIAQMVTMLNKNYTLEDDITGETKVSNPYALRQTIISLGLSDDDTIKLLTYYGLPVEATNYSGGR